MELSDYTLDLDDMENGRWLKVVDDFYVKARSLQSEAVAEYTKRKGINLSALLNINAHDADGKVQEAVNLLCDCVVLDWKGITEGKKPLPFDKERARQMFGSVKYVRVTAKLISALVDEDAFLERTRETLAGE